MKKDRQKKRTRKPIDSDRLERAAFHYLERFSASEAHFRNVMTNRIRRAQGHFDVSEEQVGWIDAIVAKALRVGALDDARYAEIRAGSLLRRGKPTGRIRSELYSKGVSGDVVEGAIDSLSEDTLMPDFAAAIHYARRRRFGPWRNSARIVDPGEKREKEIASMARAGFHFELATKIVDAPDPVELEDELEAGSEY